MRLGKLPEAWIAPPELRELRELVRYRAKLVCMRTGLKAQVKAVLAKHGLQPPVKDLWGVGGPGLARQPRTWPTAIGCASTRCEDWSARSTREIDMLERAIHQRVARPCAATRRSKQSTVSVRRWAAIFVAEIGDVTRFSTPSAVVLVGRADPEASTSPTPRSTAGGSPKPARSWCDGRRSRRSPRSAAAPNSKPTTTASRSGAAMNIARVAVARKLLTLVYYGLRDGDIRCLARRRGRVEPIGHSPSTRARETA